MQLGDILDGKYRLTQQLRSGGMGTVYVAERLALGDHVAVKVILPGQNSAIARARFLREARAAARIRHPNVVQIFDFGEIETDVPYFVMEYLDGPTLDDELHAAKRFSPARAVEIMRPVCAAVEAGHRRGVLHRDLKPGNVMLPRMDDGREIVKVLDFGLARFTTDGDTAPLTSPGALVGTYAYMAPEQVLAEEMGPACDVYSLGVLLYEMVTGRLPFSAASSFALMDKIVAGKYKPPRELIPDLPEPIAAAIAAALSREPSARPGSPDALAALFGDPAAAVTPTVSDVVAGQAEPRLTPTTVYLEAETGQQPRDTASIHAGQRRVGKETPPHGAHKTHTADWPDMTGFVCRDAELESLKSEFHAAARNEAQLVVVVGEAGVGKSSLVRAFASWAREHGAYVLTGRFFEYEGSRPSPLHTILSMLTVQTTSGDRNSTDSGAEERLTLAFGGTTTRGQAGLGDEHDKWRAFGAIAAELERKAAGRPLVLIFDDLQWAGRLNLEMLVYLKRTLGDRRTLVVGTARDVDTQRHSGSDLATWLLGQGNSRECSVLSVRPFTTDDVHTWLTSVFGRIRIRSIDVQRLEEATGGNPYYLYEVVRHLVSSGGIVRGSEGWECSELDRVALPETVTNAVRAKLFGLGKELREMLEAAAVIGDHVRFETLREATGLGEEELETLVEHALHLQLLSEEGVSRPNDYRFESKTIRRVLYDEMTARRRRRLHERVVLALESVYGDRLARLANSLCYHNHAVGHWANTLRWGLVAAEEAIAGGDTESAETSLGRAKEAADSLRADGREIAPADEMRLDLLFGTLLVRIGRPHEAEPLLREAIRLADQLGLAAAHADALFEHALGLLARGELDRGLAKAESAALAAGAAGDRSRALAARILAGNVLRRLGRTVDAEERFEAIFGMLSEKDPLSLQSLVYQNLAWIRTQRGRFDEGMDLAQRALERARAARDPMAQQQAYSTLAFVSDEMGEREAAIRLHEESLRLSRAISFRRREGIDHANIGESLYRLGRYEQAKEKFEEGLAIFVEIGDRACEGDCRVNLGRALLSIGELDDALTMLAAGIALCEATGRREYAAIGHFYTGEAHLERNELGEAKAAFSHARDIFAELEWHDRWRTEAGLARVAIAAGDTAAAKRHVDAAVKLVEQARASLPPTADYERFSEDVAEVFRIKRELER
jgi:serine/threonine protein kinase/tetratricopeptide (TPR) repeat protein